MTASAHGMSNFDNAQLDLTVARYDGICRVTDVTTKTFDIEVPEIGTATGTWESSVCILPNNPRGIKQIADYVIDVRNGSIVRGHIELDDFRFGNGSAYTQKISDSTLSGPGAGGENGTRSGIKLSGGETLVLDDVVIGDDYNDTTYMEFIFITDGEVKGDAHFTSCDNELWRWGALASRSFS